MSDAGGPDFFDEAFYLATYQDVVAGVTAGHFSDGYQHYTLHGRAEGRVCAPDFDAAWYDATYPMVAADVARGRAANVSDHWRRIGRYRGYRPSANAARPGELTRGAPWPGGLWTDAPDAGDRIAGRLDIGWITENEAQDLTTWVEVGCVVLRAAIPAHIIDAAAMALERAFQGGNADLLFRLRQDGAPACRWKPIMHQQPAVMLDPHWHEAAIRDLVFTPAIRRFLQLIFERQPYLVQSDGVLLGAEAGLHRDTERIAFSRAGCSAAVWIALEHGPATDGPVFVPASHRRTITEETAQPIALTPGDITIRHAALVHAGGIVAAGATRRGIEAHYCPEGIVPVSFESARHATRPYADTGGYGTTIY